LGIFNDVLKPNFVQRQSRLKVYNILAIPSHRFYMAVECGHWNKGT